MKTIRSAILLFFLFMLGAMALLILLSGESTVRVMVVFFDGALLGNNAMINTINRAVPLVLGGLSVAIPFRAGMFNLGVEGQMYMGALFGALAGVSFPIGAPWLHPIWLCSVSFVGGAAWAIMPVILKRYCNIHELLSTIFLNYIALYLTSYLVKFPFKGSDGIAATERIQRSAEMPLLTEMLPISWGVFFVVAIVAIVSWVLSRSPKGYEIRMTGANVVAARHGGIKTHSLSAQAFCLGGGLAGLGGGLLVSMVHYRFVDSFIAGLGFDGVTAAIIGLCQPVGTFIAGISLAALQNGALNMDILTRIPRDLIVILQAFLIILFTSKHLSLVSGEMKVSIGEE